VRRRSAPVKEAVSILRVLAHVVSPDPGKRGEREGKEGKFLTKLYGGVKLNCIAIVPGTNNKRWDQIREKSEGSAITFLCCYAVIWGRFFLSLFFFSIESKFASPSRRD
jgi:hypothetical protein